MQGKFPALELLYFDIPGKAEATRLVCHCSGIPLTDTRLTREQYFQREDNLPFGQLPCLIVDGKNYVVQSASIVRYVGKLGGLYPSDNLVASLVDAIIDQEIDLFTGLGVYTYKERFGFGFLADRADCRAEAWESLISDVLPRHLGFFERLLDGRENKSGWLAGTPEATIADFVLCPRLQWLKEYPNVPASLFEPFPKLNTWMEKFMSQPKVVQYYSNKRAEQSRG